MGCALAGHGLGFNWPLAGHRVGARVGGTWARYMGLNLELGMVPEQSLGVGMRLALGLGLGGGHRAGPCAGHLPSRQGMDLEWTCG